MKHAIWQPVAREREAGILGQTWIRGWQRGGWAALVVAGILLAGVPAQATHGGAHGYCDANGKPVLTYAPPGWEERVRAYCDHGELRFQAKQVFEEPEQNTVIKRPEDFGRWVNITLNTKNVRNPYNDVRPYVVSSSSRTLVPLRYLSEAFGATVEWDGVKEQAVVNWRARTIVVPIGKDIASVDGQQVRLDQAAVLWNNRTMVPLRFLLESVGATVAWDNINGFADITLEGAQCPPTYCDL